MYQPTRNPAPLMTAHLVASGAFRGSPLRIIDGGSRGGAETHWAAFGDQAEVFAFEPDPEECRRLNDARAGRGGGGPAEVHHPAALARGPGRATLHIARYPDSSSLLENNEALVGRFGMGAYLARVGTATVETVGVDAFAADHCRGPIDYMKLDVEGAELDVLRGAEGAVSRSLLGLSVEVWFHRDREARPLFGEVDDHLRRSGFALFDLRELNRWRRRTQCGPGVGGCVGGGQLMYANALYFRDLPALIEAGDFGPGDGSRPMALKLASLAEVFCYADFAIEVLQAGAEAGVLDPGEAGTLTALLARQGIAAGPRGGWRGAVRAGVRAAIPPALRRRIMRAILDLVAE